MVLLNQMIRTRRFEEYVLELVQMHNEEMEDKTLWDIWLHRIFDKGFDEFKKSLSSTKKEAAPTQEEVKSIAMDSRNILAGFVPDEGVNRSGTVQAAGNDSD
jgi:hypothetical protein